MCGTKIVTPPGAKIWVAALIQFTLATTFMLIFKFPKIMIVILGVMILVGTAISARVKLAPSLAPQKPIPHSAAYQILTVLIAIGGFAFLSILLFGTVMFMNSWDRWHRYEGQPYHRSDFVVERVYYQKYSKGGADMYARGTVEGQREWMTLVPYLQPVPRNEAELDERVTPGTSIPVYLFPALKGRLRVQVYQDVPPAEASRQAAMRTLNHGLTALAACAAAIFLLSFVRRLCDTKEEPALQSMGASV